MPFRSDWSDELCPIRRSLDVLGDGWVLLIIRDVLHGRGRFDTLRDNLGIIGSSEEVEELAASVDDNGGAYFVPAFSGLFAPYWRADARGAAAALYCRSASTSAGSTAASDMRDDSIRRPSSRIGFRSMSGSVP